MAGGRRWVQDMKLREGALKRQLGVPAGQRIPVATLRRAARAPGVLGRRARLALTMRSWRHNPTIRFDSPEGALWEEGATSDEMAQLDALRDEATRDDAANHLREINRRLAAEKNRALSERAAGERWLRVRMDEAAASRSLGAPLGVSSAPYVSPERPVRVWETRPQQLRLFNPGWSPLALVVGALLAWSFFQRREAAA